MIIGWYLVVEQFLTTGHWLEQFVITGQWLEQFLIIGQWWTIGIDFTEWIVGRYWYLDIKDRIARWRITKENIRLNEFKRVSVSNKHDHCIHFISFLNNIHYQ